MGQGPQKQWHETPGPQHQASAYGEQSEHEYHTPGEGPYGWASNLARLRAAKAKFDPKDVFVNTDHIKKA